MGIPVSFPSAPLSVSDSDNSLAEQILAAMGQVVGFGTAGSAVVTPPLLVPNAQVNASGVSGLQLTDSLSQLSYRHMSLALSKILGGSVVTAQSTADRALSGVFASTFQQTFDDYSAGDWTFRVGDSSQVQVVSGGGVMGGKAIRVTGYAWMEWKRNIAFDPGRIYRLRLRVRQATDPTNGQKIFYAGLVGVAPDGTTLINTSGANDYNSQHLTAPVQQTISQAFTEYTFYWKGTTVHGTPGTVDPTNPGKLTNGVTYLRPFIVFNYNGGNGIQELDVIEMMVDSVDVAIANAASAANAAIVANTNALQGITNAASASAAAAAATIAAAAANANANTRALTDLTNVINSSVTTALLAPFAVDATKLASGAVGLQNFASGLRPVQVGAALPTLPDAVNYPQGSTFFLTTDNKLYRSTGATWTVAVPVTDLNGQIVASQITANTITAGQIAAGTITATELSANSISATKIQAGAVGAVAIAAQSIIAKHLTLANWDNLWPNPGSEDASPSGYVTPNDGTDAQFDFVLADATFTGAFVRQLSVTGVGSKTLRLIAPANVGDQFYFEVQAKRQSGTDATAYAGVRFLDSSKTFIGGSLAQSSFVSTGVVTKYSVTTAVAPAGTCFVQFEVSTGTTTASLDVRFDNFYARRMADANLIVDGSIIAAKILAGNVTTDKLAANAITAKSMTLTNWDNIWPNPSSEVSPPTGADTGSPTYTGAGVLSSGSAEFYARVNVGAGAFTGDWVRSLTPTTASSFSFIEHRVAAGPGDQFYFEAEYKLNSGTQGSGGGAYIQINFLDKTGAVLSQFTTNGFGNSATYALLQITSTTVAPAGTTQVSFILGTFAGSTASTGVYYFDDVYARRMADANLIVDGSIIASKILAGSISAKHLSLFNWDNLCLEPGFEDGGSQWTFDALGSVVAGGRTPGTKCLQFNAGSGTNAVRNKNDIPCEQGQTFYAECWMDGTGMTTGGATIRLRGKNASGSEIWTTAESTTSAPTGFTKVSVTGIVPSSVVTVNVEIIGRIPVGAAIKIDDVFLRRLNDASLIVDGSIIASKIFAGAVTADKLAVGSITARSLTITNFDNLWPNPTSEDAIPSGYTAPNDGTDPQYDFLLNDGAGAFSGIWDRQLSVTGVGSKTLKLVVSASPGDQFYFEAQAKRVTGTDATAKLNIKFLDSTLATLVTYSSSTLSSGSWTPLTVTSTSVAPAGTTYVQFELTTGTTTATLDVRFDALYARRMAAGSIIVDGTIITSKLAANSIVADKITAGEITVDKITIKQGSQNLWPNGNSENSPPSTAVTTTPEWVNRANVGGSAYNGSWVRQINVAQHAPVHVGDTQTSPSADQNQIGCFVNCAPGDQFYIEAQVFIVSNAAADHAGVYIWFLDASNASVGGASIITEVSSSGSWQKAVTRGTAPSGAVKALIGMYANCAAGAINVYFDAIYACRQIPQAILDPGTNGVASSGAIRSQNYTEDGSGNPTAGAKIDLSSNTGPYIKLASGGMQIDQYIFNGVTDKNFWARLKNALGENTAAGRMFYRGNASGTAASDKANLTITHDIVNNVNSNTLLQLSITTTQDNIDAVKSIRTYFYDRSGGTSSGTGVGVNFIRLNFNDRPAYDDNTAWVTQLVLLPGVRNSGQNLNGVYCDVQVFTALGAGATTRRDPNVSQNVNWNDASAPSGGGGGSGGSCPAPWVKILLAGGKWVEAGDLHEGMQVVGFDESNPLERRVGIIHTPCISWQDRYDLFTESGKKMAFSRNHRLVVDGEGWVQIQDLVPGDKLLSITGFEIVKAVRHTGRAQVIAFEVKGCRTYFSDGVLSHNLKP
jgi:hypothetical protein